MLETDGTEICDDDTLEYFAKENQIFIILDEIEESSGSLNSLLYFLFVRLVLYNFSCFIFFSHIKIKVSNTFKNKNVDMYDLMNH